MALPIAPIAGLALRYGAVAVAAYAVARTAQPARRNQHVEDAHDELPEGVGLRRDKSQMNGTGRIRRVVRLGQTGPAFEIDASLLGRIRVRRT